MTPEEKRDAAGNVVTWKKSEARLENEVHKRREILDSTVEQMLTELEMLWDREGLGTFAYINVKLVAFDKRGRSACVEATFGQMPIRSEIEVGPAPKSEFSKAIDDAMSRLRRRFGGG